MKHKKPKSTRKPRTRQANAEVLLTQLQEQNNANNLFTLIMQRFDTVDTDNRDIKVSVVKHAEDDAKVHAIVAKHATYWGIAIKAALGMISGAFVIFITWLGMR